MTRSTDGRVVGSVLLKRPRKVREGVAAVHRTPKYNNKTLSSGCLYLDHLRPVQVGMEFIQPALRGGHRFIPLVHSGGQQYEVILQYS